MVTADCKLLILFINWILETDYASIGVFLTMRTRKIMR